MTNKLFLYKDNSEDRDCCAYIELNPAQFECNHYFGRVTLCGAAYYGKEFADYEEAIGACFVDRNNYTQMKYFNFEKFGQDLANEDECYHELSDGRIVLFNY